MVNKVNNSTEKISALVPKLLEAGLTNNHQRLEVLSLNAIRTLKSDFPEMAEQLGSLLSRFTANSGALRWQTSEPPPIDLDAGLSLLRVQPIENTPEPILPPLIHTVVERFLRERLESEKLLKQGFSPPRSLLLKGAPGTGKTMLARWLAQRLGMRLVVLDLASSISSYLGKTGSNLRRSLDYARATPCVLLIDEFDAIGKRRDDATEVGELKRIVNVLLKELEEWPMHSILVGATNHPELLDPAINRRFDLTLEIPLPGEIERKAIFTRACSHFAETLPDGLITALVQTLEGQSGSDLDTIAQAAVRHHVIDGTSFARCIVEELEKHLPDGLPKKKLGALVKSLQESTGLSVREIAELVDKSPSAVQYHLTKEETNEPTEEKNNSRKR